jgi:hypothetical protein
MPDQDTVKIEKNVSNVNLDKNVSKDNKDNKDKTVISIIDNIKSESILNISKDERLIVFDKLSEELPDMEQYFYSFSIIIDKIIADRSFTTTSTIIEFILLTLCNYKFIFPIVEIEEKLLTQYYKIKVSTYKKCYMRRFDRGKPILVEYIAAPNADINVVGIVNHDVYFDNLNIANIFTGHFDIFDLALYKLRNAKLSLLTDIKQLTNSYVNYIYKFKNVDVKSCLYTYEQLNDKQLPLNYTKFDELIPIPTFNLTLLDKTNIILTELSKLINAKLTNYNQLHLDDLYAFKSKALTMYSVAELKGTEYPLYAEFIDKLTNEKQRSTALKLIEKVKITNYNKLQHIYHIMDELFDKKKITSILQHKHNVNNILDFMSANDAKLVKAKIAHDELRIKNIFNNKCQHVSLLRKYRSALTNTDKQKLFNALKSFFKETKQGYILCNTCGYDLICPHVVVQQTMMYKPFVEIKTALTPFISGVQKNDIYYCKICSEQILNDIENEDYVVTSQIQMDEDLKFLIYEELHLITKYVIVKTIINKRALERSIVDRIYNFIYLAEKNLIKHKLDTDSELRIKLRLYSNIYIWAFLIHIASRNENIQIGKDVKGQKVPGMLEFAIKAMLNDRKNIIVSAGANIEFLKNKLIKAYKQIAGDGALIVQNIKPFEINYMVLIRDPIYHYIYNMHWFFIDNGSLKPPGITDMKLIEQLLGKLSQDNNIYGRVKVPVESHNDNALHHIQYTSYKLFIESIYNPRDVVATKKLIEFENIHINKLNLFYNKPVELQISNSSSRFKEDSFRLSLIYDEKGTKHVWDKYIFDYDIFTGKEVVSTYSAKQISELIDKNIQLKKSFIDILSSTTGVRLSETNKLSDEKIAKNLNIKSNVTNFYTYYTTRCLVKNIHEFVNSTCTHCHINTAYFKDIFSADAIKFYEEHKNKYFSDIKPIIRISDVKNNVPIVKSIDPKWVFNSAIIDTISREYKINPNFLKFLGLTTNEKLQDIKSGFIKQNETDLYEFRYQKLISYIVLFIDEYYKFKNYKYILHPSKEQTLMIETNSIDTNKLELLPIITVNWDILNDKHNNLYALEILLNLVLHCTNKIFSKYIIDKIIKNDSLCAIADADDIKIFNIKYVTNVDERPSNEEKEDTEEQPIIDEKQEKPDDVGDTNEPLSNDAFDVEDDDDEELIHVEVD